jgi:DNA-binding transcriptional ArsR family regulator
MPLIIAPRLTDRYYLATVLIMQVRNVVFRAMADPTRREILRLLRASPRTSGEIAARFNSSWPTVSRHLGVLKDAGLVTAERNGQEIHYELNTSVFQDLVEHLTEWVKPNGRPR